MSHFSVRQAAVKSKTKSEQERIFGTFFILLMTLYPQKYYLKCEEKKEDSEPLFGDT